MNLAGIDFAKVEERILALVAKPDEGAKCEEAAMGIPFYVPCGKPAEFIIANRNERVNMCPMCANHNIKNRGASFLLTNGETLR